MTKVFSAYATDGQLQRESSSGGMFTLLASHYIENGGIVFGATFDNQFNVCHIGVSNVADLKILRGSKYVQSRLSDTFREIRALLANGTPVMFCGTPCQVKGLNAFIGKNLSGNLITVDFACHGVPSPKVWDRYKGRDSLQDVSFRSKRYGWKTYSLLLKYNNKKQHSAVFTHDRYMQTFIRNYSLRPSCYHCTAKGIERVADITLADFWGASRFSPKMNNWLGVSLIFVHSDKGMRTLEAIPKNEYVINDESINDVIRLNPSLMQSPSIPMRRKDFFEQLDSDLSFEELYRKYVRQGIMDDVKSWMKTTIKLFIFFLNRLGIKIID